MSRMNDSVPYGVQGCLLSRSINIDPVYALHKPRSSPSHTVERMAMCASASCDTSTVSTERSYKPQSRANKHLDYRTLPLSAGYSGQQAPGVRLLNGRSSRGTGVGTGQGDGVLGIKYRPWRASVVESIPTPCFGKQMLLLTLRTVFELKR